VASPRCRSTVRCNCLLYVTPTTRLPSQPLITTFPNGLARKATGTYPSMQWTALASAQEKLNGVVRKAVRNEELSRPPFKRLASQVYFYVGRGERYALNEKVTERFGVLEAMYDEAVVISPR
jgi:hypothetical protein